MPTLNELRAHLRDTGRADLTWEDISDYRIRDASGQIWDSDPNTAGVQSVGSGEPILLDNLPRFDERTTDPQTTGHISQTAVDALNSALAAAGSTAPVLGFDGAGQLTDGTYAGLAALIMNGWVDPSTMTITASDPAVHAAVGEVLLESLGDHYIAGDGRANENFGLTTLHHVFHEDHNVQRVNLETSILIQSHAADINKWQVAVSGSAPSNSHIGASAGHYVAVDGVVAQDSDGNLFVAGAGDTLATGSTFLFSDGVKVSAAGSYTDASGYISWDQDKLFNGTKLIVEMEYQHVAIDQYARLVTPDLPEFVTYDSTINANISMEYAESAFRFGHSQLRDTIDGLDPNNVVTGQIQHYALATAFLTPAAFAAVGPGAIVEGMTHQVGNETDEFVTPAVQQSLLGQPLDLAAINIARGRDLGIPTLNETRKALYDAIVAERLAGGVQAQAHAKIDLGSLKPYSSWDDFQASLAHPESIVNLIAAYSFDGDTTKAQLVLDLASSGTDIPNAYGWTATDAAKFMANAYGTGETPAIAGAGNFNQIDLWLGGLAESHVIGGKLGPTFNAIFEDQMERLMDGDRFYYLYRLFGALPTTLNLNESITLEQFKDVIERTTGTQYLNGDVMTYADSYVSLYLPPDDAIGDPTVVSALSPMGLKIDQIDHKYGTISEELGKGVYSASGNSIALNGQAFKTLTAADGYKDADGVLITGSYIFDARPTSSVTDLNGNFVSGYNAHEVVVGTDYADYIDGGDGDDTIYGGAGNDILVGNGGGDHVYGGDGNDLIFGGGGTAGADVEDFLDGGAGDDVIYGGVNNGATEILIAGDGNDFLYGEAGIDEGYGGRGDDYIDLGSDTDVGFGDDGNDYLFGGEGPDELHGGNGDDIVDGGSGTDKVLGENGDDILFGGIGGGVTQGDSDELVGDEQGVDDGFDLANYSNSSIQLDVAADLTQQNLQAAPGTAHGFQPFNDYYSGVNGVVGSKFGDILIGDDAVDATDPVAGTPISFANWLVGGSGSDNLRGNGGNDVIVGGSIKISQLIGTYQNLGADPYTSTVGGASHRADPAATLMGGILDWASLGGAFDKHFTDLLQSKARKDFLLGDSGTDSGSTDTAGYSGNLSDYTFVALDASGNVINAPLANIGAVFAVEVTDHGGGTPRTLDGTDLVLGVEKFQFADGTKTLAQVLDSRPTGSLVFTVEDALTSASGVANPANAARFTPVSALFDADNISGLNPTGAVTTGVAFSWVIPVGTPAATAAVDGSGRLVLHTTAGLLITEKGAYTDANGTPETASTTYNFIVGSSAANTLTGANVLNPGGGTYGDVLVGLAGADTLNGGAGDDRLYGGAANDTLNGGAGNDSLDGGAGNDLAVYSGAAAAATFGLSGANLTVTTAAGGTDTLTNIERLTFGPTTFNLSYGSDTANDTRNGTGVADLLLGFGGADMLNGAGGADVLIGGAGADTLNGGAGADVMIGGADNDTYVVDNALDVVTENANEGTDLVQANINNYTLAANVENLTLMGGAGWTGTGNALDNIILGNSGSNTLTGGGGNDTINGGNGNDTLIGGNGNDTLIGGAGGDTLNGGAGNDTYAYSVLSELLASNADQITNLWSGRPDRHRAQRSERRPGCVWRLDRFVPCGPYQQRPERCELCSRRR